MNKLYALILILIGFSINAQSDTICNPSFEDSLINWEHFVMVIQMEFFQWTAHLLTVEI